MPDITADAKLDAIAKHLDSISNENKEIKDSLKRFDSIPARVDAVCAKVDEWDEKAKADKAKKDAEEMAMADKAKKDAEEEEKAKKDAEEKAMKDAAEKEEQAKKDAAEKEEKERKDAAARGDSDLRKKIAELEKRVPVEVSDDNRKAYTDAQVKAERVAQAFGDTAGAPRHLNGETPHDYQRRLLTKYKSHSAAWKDKDLSKVHDSVLDIAEEQIYGCAMDAALHPKDVPEGQLRMVQTRDVTTGRVTNRFVGSETAAWAPFRNPYRAGKIQRQKQELH